MIGIIEQILLLLEELDQFTPIYLTSFFVPTGQQYIVYGKVTVDDVAIIDGQLVVI